RGVLCVAARELLFDEAKAEERLDRRTALHPRLHLRRGNDRRKRRQLLSRLRRTPYCNRAAEQPHRYRTTLTHRSPSSTNPTRRRNSCAPHASSTISRRRSIFPASCSTS